MSDMENPYNSGQAPIVPEQNQIAGSLTGTMLRYLKEASPWLRFLGIFGFISCGLTILGGVFAIFLSGYFSNSFSEVTDFPVWIIFVLYTVLVVALGVVVFFPARFAYNFGSKIKNYQFSNSEEDLEQAFKNCKSLCKFFGILGVISLAMIPLSFILSIVVGVIAAINL